MRRQGYACPLHENFLHPPAGRECQRVARQQAVRRRQVEPLFPGLNRWQFAGRVPVTERHVEPARRVVISTNTASTFSGTVFG